MVLIPARSKRSSSSSPCSPADCADFAFAIPAPVGDAAVRCDDAAALLGDVTAPLGDVTAPAGGHSWSARIADRVRGNGCPYCAGKRPIIGVNDLATINPTLAKEWNYNKNSKAPSEFLPHSRKKVWWICSKGHEWEATIDSRSRGNGCKYCAGQAVIPGTNDLKTLYPRLADEWDYELNYPLLPTQIMSGSGKKIWWKCKYGHSWCISPNNRTSQYSNCPICSAERGTSFPEQAIYYYINQLVPAINRYIINDVEIDIFIPNLNLGIEYDGIYFHNSKSSSEREQKKNMFCKNAGIRLIRVKETRIPMKEETDILYRKIGKNSTSLETIINQILEIIADYDIEINQINVDLKKDDITIYNKYLSLEKENSIATHNPNLLKEWDYEKNKDISPTTISYGSKKKVWWLCPLGHSYKATISHRTTLDSPTACPICAGQQILSGYNDLATKRPDLILEWDFKLNNVNPSELSPNSSIKAHWICPKGHPYIASITKRNHGRNCPVCAGKQIIVGINDFATLQPQLASEWDYKKNELLPTNYTEHSNKKVYWKCKLCKHSWLASINNRVRGRCGCPECKKR